MGKIIKLQGNGRRLSEEEIRKLKEQIKLSRRQTEDDSKVDRELMETEFNF